MAIYVLFSCGGYDEMPDHQIIWAKNCDEEAALAEMWSNVDVQKWAHQKSVLTLDHFKQLVANKERSIDSTEIFTVYWLSLHRAT